MPRWRIRRGGFTLVELLVVIAIIGMIVALAVPTIFSAIRTARNAAVKSEIDLLHTALMNYKNEYGSFPPANMQGLWSGGAVNQRHPVYKHLVKIFPRLSEPTSGANSPYEVMAKMSPAQALVFWLSGFYQNPENPITNDGASGTRKKFFDFDQTRLYAASNYAFDGTPQQFVPRNDPQASTYGPPVYFTPHPQSGTPYVYFDNRCYDTPSSTTTEIETADNAYVQLSGQDAVYFAKSTNANVSRAAPYLTSLPPAETNPSWSQRHMLADSFQLIAAGADGFYGRKPLTGSVYAQTAFPSTAQFSGSPYVNQDLTYPAADGGTDAPGHGDNITNFADRPLEAAIEVLKKK
jgi:prepilin-type N-terminal cleavage/methylation domain-containing protein